VVVNYSASADHAQAIVDGIGKAAGRAFAVRADVSKVWLPLASRCAKGGLTDSGRTPVGQWNCSRVWLLNARADFLLRAFAPAIDRVGN
jgi:hypothetical protein